MVDVRLPVVPRDASPLATGLGGAGAAVGSFMQAQAFDEERKLREREVATREQALEQRGKQQQLQVFRYLEQQELDRLERQKKADAEARETQSRGDVFGALKSLYGIGAEQPAPQTNPADAMPQEWAREIDTIGQGFRDGTLSAAQAGDALKLIATSKEESLRRVATQQLTQRITDEIAAGAWSPENALGMQMDVDGDGQPDPISETPQLLLRMLGEGKVNPAQVEAMHARVKQAMRDERARILTRETEAAKADKAITDNLSLSPEARRLSVGRIAAWRADEYPQTKEGLEQFQRDLGAAQAGLVPIEKDGQRFYVSEAEAKDALFKIRTPTADDAVDQRTQVMARFLGDFRDDPALNDAENDARWKKYRARMAELNAEFFGGAAPVQDAAPASTAPPLTPGMSKAARARQLLGSTPLEKATVEQKASIARQLRGEFPEGENK